MKDMNMKKPRIVLPPDAYALLRLQVLRRDGWRCQNCGSLQNLEVHHLRQRSRQGDDGEENLITLCYECHRTTHGKVRSD
jgi:5-methylcytosine-specific restriction endonuclease McrA